jgi:hypothetical protein
VLFFEKQARAGGDQPSRRRTTAFRLHKAKDEALQGQVQSHYVPLRLKQTATLDASFDAELKFGKPLFPTCFIGSKFEAVRPYYAAIYVPTPPKHLGSKIDKPAKINAVFGDWRYGD